MNTAIAYPYLRCAVGLISTPALVGACFGEYVALASFVDKLASNNTPTDYLVSTSLLFIFPLLSGVVGWIQYLPPAVLLVCIGVALRGYRTIYPIAVLVISGGLLSAGWSWVIDTVLTENSSAWSSFLWVSPKLSYGGPAVFGGLASLIMALIVLPHYSQEAVAHNVGSN